MTMNYYILFFLITFLISASIGRQTNDPIERWDTDDWAVTLIICAVWPVALPVIIYILLKPYLNWLIKERTINRGE